MADMTSQIVKRLREQAQRISWEAADHIEALENALRPFAAYIEFIDKNMEHPGRDDAECLGWVPNRDGSHKIWPVVTYKHLRSARAVMMETNDAE